MNELAKLQQLRDEKLAEAKALFGKISERADQKATAEELETMGRIDAEVQQYSKQIEQSSRLMDAIKANAAAVPAANAAAASGTPAPAAGTPDQFSLSRAVDSAVRVERGGTPAVEFKNQAPGKQVFKNLGEQMQAIWLVSNDRVPGSDKIMAGNMLEAVEKYAATGLGTQKDPDGGYLIEAEFQTAIMRQQFEVGQLANDCRKIPIGQGKDSFKGLALDDNSRANGSRLGGIVAYWVNEADTATPARPKLRKVEFGLGKLMALGYATSELLEDAGQLAEIMGAGFAEEFAFMLDDAILSGTGTDRPLGILNSKVKATLVIPIETVVPQSQRIQFENVLKMRNAMPARFYGGAKWYLNQELMNYLPFMKVTLGTISYPVYLPGGDTGNAATTGQYDMLFGRPVVPIEQCPGAGNLGDIVFANMQQYLIGQKGTSRLESSMHVRFLNDEMAFRATQRIGGMPLPNDVITPYKSQSGFQLSSIINLAGGRTGF